MCAHHNIQNEDETDLDDRAEWPRRGSNENATYAVDLTWQRGRRNSEFEKDVKSF